MDTTALFEPSLILLVACSVTLAAGVVKGMVGFAMPMILVSGLTTFMPPELALAGLILPTVVTNGIQALRQGGRAAWQSIVKFRVFMLIGLVFLLASAQMVRVLPAQVMYLVIGGPVALFCLLQIFGWQPVLAPGSRPVLEGAIGAVAGFVGGLSGVWGPPTVAYLTAMGTEKREQIRVQGVIYGLGAVALTVAHIGSGVLNAETAKFSAILIVPAVVGMWLGGLIHDRIDQRAFRRATLFILLVAALNLVRRALF